jgi:hypothetical protein
VRELDGLTLTYLVGNVERLHDHRPRGRVSSILGVVSIDEKDTTGEGSEQEIVVVGRVDPAGNDGPIRYNFPSWDGHLTSRITTPMLKVASSNDRGLLEQAAGGDVKSEPDELGVCPAQRSS